MKKNKKNCSPEIDLTVLALIEKEKITGKTIEMYFNLSTRERFHSIERLRNAGEPVLGDKNYYDPGYFIATTEQEVEQWFLSKEKEHQKLKRQKEKMLKRIKEKRDSGEI